MIGAMYSLQVLVFILRRKWDMVGWMVFYILAIPIFPFMLPIYSFWRMDDFSWHATRAGRVWQEDHCACALVPYVVAGLMLTRQLDRTKASLIPR